MFNINFMENILLNFYQTFSFAIFHIIDLEMILSNYISLMRFIFTLLFPFYSESSA